MEGTGTLEGFGSGNAGNMGGGRIVGGLNRSFTSLTTLCIRARMTRRSSYRRNAFLQVTQSDAKMQPYMDILVTLVQFNIIQEFASILQLLQVVSHSYIRQQYHSVVAPVMFVES